MSNHIKTILFVSCAIISLSACSSSKGPGAIGSKDDIVVVNKGLDGAKMPQPFTDNKNAQGEDFTSVIEQAEPVPTPEVAAPEVLKEPEQIKTAVSAPVNNPAPVAQPPEPQPEIIEQAAPEKAPEQLQQSTVYPAEDYPVNPQQTQTIETPLVPAMEKIETPALVETSTATVAPAVEQKKIKYPLDPNAPYSPKAMAAAAAAAGTPVTEPELSPSGINLNDPAIIRSVQSKLAAKSFFVGSQTGIMDANLMNSIVRYQAENNLAVGVLTEETLKHMGIIE